MAITISTKALSLFPNLINPPVKTVDKGIKRNAYTVPASELVNKVLSADDFAAGSVMDLLDLERLAIPVITYRDLDPEDAVDVIAYADPSSLFYRVIQPEKESYRSTVNSLSATIDAAGVYAGLAAGTTSISLRNIPALGFMLMVDALDTQSGQTRINVSIVSAGGVTRFEFPFKLADVETRGKFFIARTALGVTRSQTSNVDPQAAFGSFIADQQITWPVVGTVTETILRHITEDADSGMSGAENYIVITGTNVTFRVFPIPINRFTKFAYYLHMFSDSLDQFGDWVLDHYLNGGALKLA